MNDSLIRYLIRATALASLVFCCTVFPLLGQRILTLDEALEQARKSHLYQARLQRVEALQGRLAQASKRPNPTLSSALGNGGVFGEGGDTELSLEFSQPWERGGKRQVQERLAQTRVRQAELEAADYLRELSADIRRVYLQLLRAQHERSLLMAQGTRLENLMEFDQLRVDQGEIPSINLEFLSAEKAAMTARVNHLETEERRAQYHLITFMGVAIDQRFAAVSPEWTEPALPPVEELIRLALGNRPDLEKTRTAVTLAEHQIEAEKAVGSTDWEWGLGYTFARDSHDSRDIEPFGVIDSITARSHVLQFKITIPLQLWDDNSGNLTAALATRKSLESELAHHELMVRDEVFSAYNSYQHNQKEALRFRQQVVPRLENSLQRIEAAYQLTGDDLLGWLGLQRDYWDAVVDQIDADFMLRESVIELEKAVGGKL